MLIQQLDQFELSLGYADAIVQTIRGPLVVLDRNLRVLMVNRAFCQMFKVTAEETEGKLIYELGDGQWNIPSLRKLLEEILYMQSVFEDFEVKHAFPRIGRKTMILNARLIQQGGERILLAIEDITERRELERRKDDFISVASHELKNPLAVISGYAQMMQRDAVKLSPQELSSYLSRMQVQVDKLLKLSEHLLDTAKIEAGQLKLQSETFSVDDLLTETVESFQVIAPSYHISGEGKTGRQIVADRERISRVLSNLISNAIKYSPDADTIIVRVSDSAEAILFSVQDFGLGISREDQVRIFERFYRVNTTFPGSGLGLYVSAEIVRRHGGMMWVESTLGQGSTFFFTLPLKARDRPL